VKDVDYLAGPAEIAQVLGVDANTINAWKRRSIGFPAPLVHLKSSAIWDVRQVIAWADATGRPVAKRDYRAPRAPRS